MRVAEVVGNVTLSRCHASFEHASLRLALPLSLENLREDLQPTSESVVVYDELGAGIGNRIMLSEGAEAAQPFRPELKPVDAYNAGILDDITLADGDQKNNRTGTHD